MQNDTLSQLENSTQFNHRQPLAPGAAGTGLVSSAIFHRAILREKYASIVAGNHYSQHATNRLKARVSEFSRCVGVKVRKPHMPAKKAHTRGRVMGFSARSRNRLLIRMQQVRNVGNAFFVTLTYNDRCDTSPQRVKRDLDAYAKRFRRAYPDAWMLWKMEIKRRVSGRRLGELVPHFHLILGNMGDVQWSDLVEWQDKAWAEITGQASLVNTRRCKSTRHAMNYVAKYCAKEDASGTLQSEYSASSSGDADYSVNMHGHGSQAIAALYTGRRWGEVGKMDRSQGGEVTLDRAAWVEFRRLLRRWLARSGGSSRFAERLRRWSPERSFWVMGMGDDITPNLLYRMALAAQQSARGKPAGAGTF